LLQCGRAFQSPQKSPWNTAKAHLRTHQRAHQHGPRLVLATAIDGMQDRLFKIILEGGRQVVGGG